MKQEKTRDSKINFLLIIFRNLKVISDIDSPAEMEAIEAIDLESEELQRGLEADSEESGELSDHDDEDDDGLVKPKRKKRAPAPVWLCGGEKIEGGGRCKLCGKTFMSENFNTSNITDHIVKKHATTAEGKRLKVLKKEKKETDLKRGSRKKKRTSSSSPPS